MNTQLFSINWSNVKSALVSTLLMAVLAMAIYVIGLGDFFKISTHELINIGGIAFLTGFVSLVKAYLTNSQGQVFTSETSVTTPTV